MRPLDEALVGHDRAQATFAAALDRGRVHHGWLLAGPEGIGKARFARAAAAALLSQGTDRRAAIAARIADGNETALTTIARSVNSKTGKLRGEIVVDDVRDAKRGFNLAATDGGWRVAIIDAAEDMNRTAANAVLKLLEEPPDRTVFFLVSHAPGRLLPTIRSRCVRLDFAPLGDAALDAAFEAAMGEPADPLLLEASGGSVGRAMALLSGGGLELRYALQGVLSALPGALDRTAIHRLADDAAVDADRFGLAAELLIGIVARLATASTGTDAPPQGFEALARSDRAASLAEATDALSAQRARTLALNLDRRLALLDMFATTERALAARSS